MCCFVAVVALLHVPHQIRDHRLRARGVETDAVCDERIRRGGYSVIKISCTYRPSPTRKVSEALVYSPVPAPAVGGTFTVVFDPKKPTSVESAHYLSSSASRSGYLWQAAAVALAVVGFVLRAVLG